jgi:hypothetical protein
MVKIGCWYLRIGNKKMLNLKREVVKAIWVIFNNYVKNACAELSTTYEDVWRSFVASCIPNLDVRFLASRPGRCTPAKRLSRTHFNWRLV